MSQAAAPIIEKFSTLALEDQDEIIAAALDRLAERNQKQAVVLIRTIWHSERLDVVARTMGVQKPAIVKLKQRALKHLRKILVNELTSRGFTPGFKGS